MDKVAVDVYKIGKKRGKDQGILIYKWPRSDGELYLGGAHGLIGILYILLNWSQRCPTLSKSKDFK